MGLQRTGGNPASPWRTSAIQTPSRSPGTAATIPLAVKLRSQGHRRGDHNVTTVPPQVLLTRLAAITSGALELSPKRAPAPHPTHRRATATSRSQLCLCGHGNITTKRHATNSTATAFPSAFSWGERGREDLLRHVQAQPVQCGDGISAARLTQRLLEDTHTRTCQLGYTHAPDGARTCLAHTSENTRFAVR